MILLVLLCALVFTLLAGAWYAYKKAFFSPYKKRDYLHIPGGSGFQRYREDMERIFIALADRPFEQVSILSQEGLKLAGRYYHVQDSAALDICFHGYRSSPLTDFCCQAVLSFRQEHNLLLVDQRAHGDSQGRTISFGIRERQDVLSWVNYALERFGDTQTIFLYGISMGASTVLMAAELDLPENVRGIIADCPYSSPRKIIQRVGEKMGISPLLSWPLALVGARVYGGFDLDEADPVRAAAKSGTPILLIHGEADGFVPCEMSEEIYKTNVNLIERHTFPGADHGISYLTDPERYGRIVTDFTERHG